MVQTRSGRTTQSPGPPVSASHHSYAVSESQQSDRHVTDQLHSVMVQPAPPVTSSPQSAISRLMGQLGLGGEPYNVPVESQQADMEVTIIRPTLKILQHTQYQSIREPSQLRAALGNGRTATEVVSAVFWFKKNQNTPYLKCIQKGLQIALQWSKDQGVGDAVQILLEQQLQSCEDKIKLEAQCDHYTSLALEASPEEEIRSSTQYSESLNQRETQHPQPSHSNMHLTAPISRPAPRYFTAGRRSSPVIRSQQPTVIPPPILNPFGGWTQPPNSNLHHYITHNLPTQAAPLSMQYSAYPQAQLPPMSYQLPSLPPLPHAMPNMHLSEPTIPSAPITAATLAPEQTSAASDRERVAILKTVNDAKIGKLQPFTGEQNVKGFLQMFEGWADIKNVTGKVKLIALVAHLNGDALDLIQNEGPFESYEAAAECLLHNYAEQAKKFYYELLQLRRSTKSISEYNASFSKLRNKAKPYLNHLTEIENYISGLEPEALKQKLAINNPKTLREAMELAQKLDNLYQQSKVQSRGAQGQQTTGGQRTQCKKCFKWHNVADKHICQTTLADRGKPARDGQPARSNWRAQCAEAEEPPAMETPQDSEPPVAAAAEDDASSEEEYPGSGFY